MKKLIAISLLIVSLVLIFSFSSANDSLPQNVYLSISCDNNFIFSRYDVDIYIDTVKISTLSHGQKASYTISTTIGSHTIWFYKFDNYDVKGSLAFNFTNDTDISCKIHCRNNRIDVSNESVIPKPTPEPTPIPPYHLTLDTIELFLAKGESQTVSAKIENLAANKTEASIEDVG